MLSFIENNLNLLEHLCVTSLMVHVKNTLTIYRCAKKISRCSACSVRLVKYSVFMYGCNNTSYKIYCMH